MIARAADGGLRDALSLADQVLSLGADARVTADRVREALGLVPEDEYLTALDLVAEGRAGDVFGFVGRLAEAGVDFGLFLTGFGDALRALLAVALGGAAPDVGEATRAALAERAGPGAPGPPRAGGPGAHAPAPRRGGAPVPQERAAAAPARDAARAVRVHGPRRGARGRAARAAGRRRRRPERRARAPGDTARRARTASPTGVGRPATRPAARRPRRAGASLRAAFDARVSDAAPRAAPPRHAAGALSSGPPARCRAATAPPRPTAAPALAAPAAAPPSADDFAPPLDDDAPDAVDGAAPVDPRAPAVRAAAAGAGDGAIDPQALAARWDDVVAAARAARPLVGSALAATRPVAVSAAGAVTVELVEPNPAFAQALESAHGDVLAAVRRAHPAAVRVLVRSPAGAAPGAPQQRLTAEGIRAERLASLARRDPVLGAAIAALDLDLLD
jgi:DNA polymerase-3 subunit gamma/tau